MALKTRKEIRKEAEALSAELAQLKTPAGLAAYMFSLQGDEAFEEAFRTEIERLSKEAAADREDEETEENETEDEESTTPITGSPVL